MPPLLQGRRASRYPSRKSRTRKPRQGLNLPTEILLQITLHLPKSSWLSLRLVSRSLYAFSSNLPLITELWFGPYSEDRSVFENVCNHPFLGSHVTTILYDITRFEDFSLEELRARWPRPPRWARERGYRRQTRKDWIENHPGLWQYRKLVDEGKSESFHSDEVQILTEGLKKLPNVGTIRLAFAFQKRLLVTDKERMSPLRRYSDVEWISREAGRWRAQRPVIDDSHVRNILEAISRSGVLIEVLDLWQDFISVAPSAFNFKEPLEDLSAIFSRLRTFTLKIPESSTGNLSDLRAFRELLANAKGLRELHLCIDGKASMLREEKRDTLKLLVEDHILAQMREVEWVGRPRMLGNPYVGFDYESPWPGTVWIFEG